MLFTVSIVLIGGAACGPSDDSSGMSGTTLRNLPAHLDITVTDASGVRTASIECIGTAKGTGYLAESRALGAACITANISHPVADFLRPRKGEDSDDPRSDCKLYIAARKSVELPKAPDGKATVTGTYRGQAISREVDPTRGECDRALWELMQPLFVPSEQELVVSYPKGVQ